MKTKNTLGISLKGFKHYKGMSQETNAFTSGIVLNGVLVGDAENDGHGGCTFVRLNEKGRNIPALVAADSIREFDDGSLTSIVDDLVSDEIEAREVERLKKKVAKDLSTMVLFNRKGDKAGSFRTYKANGKTPEQVLAFANEVAKQPDVTRVLNLLPFDEAFALLVRVD